MGTLLRLYEHKGHPCIYVKYEKNLAYSMALRDAIANGLAEIRETAEELILDLQIELQIKNAVVRHETSIFVELPSGTNLFVIHSEMIKQIVDEGFHVEYRRPCCEEPDMFLFFIPSSIFRYTKTMKTQVMCAIIVMMDVIFRTPLRFHRNIMESSMT